MFIRYSRDSVTIRGRSTASSAPGLLYSRIHQHDHQGTPALHVHASLKAHCCANIDVCVLQNLQTRVTDLQGQISRLNAERLQAQEDAAVARAAKGSHEREYSPWRMSCKTCAVRFSPQLLRLMSYHAVCHASHKSVCDSTQACRGKGRRRPADGVYAWGYQCCRSRAAAAEGQEPHDCFSKPLSTWVSLTPISAVRMHFSMFSLYDAAFCCMAAGLGRSLLQLNPINSVAGAASVVHLDWHSFPCVQQSAGLLL